MEKNSTKRCPSGIDGLDELIEGGFPRGRSILVTGACGTGKTILATQFIYKGIVEYDEPGILVLLEQNPDEFKEDMLEFNFDLNKLEDENRVIIVDASLSKLTGDNLLGNIPSAGKVPISSKSFSLLPGETTLEKLTEIVIRAAKKINAKRIAIDSIPALDIMVKDHQEARKLILTMNYRLKNAGLTTILVSETDENLDIPTRGVERYVVDGVLFLNYTTVGPDAGRTLIIDKMRRTSHSENIHSIKFVKNKGIRVINE